MSVTATEKSSSLYIASIVSSANQRVLLSSRDEFLVFRASRLVRMDHWCPVKLYHNALKCLSQHINFISRNKHCKNDMDCFSRKYPHERTYTIYTEKVSRLFKLDIQTINIDLYNAKQMF